MVSLKSPCATLKKGRGGFHRNARVSVIISYRIMAKSRAKKGISSGRSLAVSRKDNLSSVLGWQRRALDTTAKRHTDLSFAGLLSPQTRKHFPLSCSGGSANVHPPSPSAAAATAPPLYWVLLPNVPEHPRSPWAVPDEERLCRGSGTATASLRCHAA